MKLEVLNVENAPEQSQATLQKIAKNYGFVPNLMGLMAHAPALLNGYVELAARFEQTSLNPTERLVLLISISRLNGCEYCVSAHSTAASMQKAPSDVIEALREGRAIADPKLEALRRFAEIVVERRGWPEQEAVQAFLDAGFEKHQVLEVVFGVGLKTLTNYTNHIVSTQLDPAFEPTAWTAPQPAATSAPVG